MEFDITQNQNYIVICYKTTFNNYRKSENKITKSNEEFRDFQEYIKKTFPFYLLLSSVEPVEYFGLLTEKIESEYQYEQILKSAELVQFLESDFKFTSKPVKRTNSTSFFSKKTKEIDIYFELFEKEVNEFQSIVSSVGKLNEVVSQKEADMSKSLGNMQQLLSINSFSEENKLKRYQLQLQTLAGFRAKAKKELIVLLKDSDQVKDALEYRTQCLQDYEEACIKTQKKVYQLSRLQQSSSINQVKVDKELEEMAVIKKNEQEHKENLKFTSDVLRRELEIYKKNRNTKFEQLMDDYVSTHQSQLSATIE